MTSGAPPSDSARVLVLDDDEDLRDSLADVFMMSGAADCVCVGSVDELAAQEVETLGCKIAVLDINLGPGKPSGLDAHAWLVRHGFTGQIVFLTGHARSHPLVSKACQLQNVIVLSKPLDFDQIRRLLEEAVP